MGNRDLPQRPSFPVHAADITNAVTQAVWQTGAKTPSQNPQVRMVAFAFRSCGHCELSSFLE